MASSFRSQRNGRQRNYSKCKLAAIVLVSICMFAVLWYSYKGITQTFSTESVKAEDVFDKLRERARQRAMHDMGSHGHDGGEGNHRNAGMSDNTGSFRRDGQRDDINLLDSKDRPAARLDKTNTRKRNREKFNSDDIHGPEVKLSDDVKAALLDERKRKKPKNLNVKNRQSNSKSKDEEKQQDKKKTQGFVPAVGPKKATLVIDTTKSTFRTHRHYLSLGIDSNLLRNNWEGFNFKSVRLQTLARALSPTIVRFMGSDGDRMTFEPDCKKPGSARKPFPFDVREKKEFFPHDEFSFSCKDWDLFHSFCKSVGWRVLFGVNSQTRFINDRSESIWNETNFRQLLAYSIKKGYASNMDFEFGNEPDLFNFLKFKHQLTGAQFAADYHRLRKILNKPKYSRHTKNATIGGPGLAKNTMEALQFLEEFMENVGDAVDVVTWHHYYGGYDINTLEDATCPDVLDTLRGYIRKITDVIYASPSGKKRRIWLAETSSTWAPSGNNVFESYAMGFMLLDKLGVSAQEKMELVVRQTFYGFWFALVDLGMWPTPGYWTSYLYITLVGREVLNVTVPEYGKRVRMYAHCTNREKTNYPPGSVTIYGMNLYDTPVTVTMGAQFKGQLIHEYLLTPFDQFWGIAAKYTALNGQLLVMPNDNTFPEMAPRVVQPGSSLTLPGKRYAFYVLPAANAAACQ